jgi:Flp pilus assembly protein TadD
VRRTPGLRRLPDALGAVALSLLWGFGATSARETDAGGAEGLLERSVCVLGEVPGGKFEASGFVVSPGDLVLTTAHGIASARNLRVKLADGRVFAARLDRLGDETADLALLVVSGIRLVPAELGSVAELRVGDPVRTVGCPAGFDFSLSQGVVSSIRSTEYGYPLIQSDVPVNPGSSGGPLFDSRGRVVGIIKGQAAGRERISFALPIDLGKILLDEADDERRALERFNQAVLETRPEEKVRLYREAVSLAPHLLEAHYNLALSLERLGQRTEAEEHYRDALRLRADYLPALLNLGANLHDQGRLAEAVETYRTALAAAPHDPRVRNNLAEAYRALGRKDEARREFERVLAEHPDYAPAHYGLAVLYDDDLGNRRQAAIHYRRYLALSPDAADAERVRDWLRRAEAEGER